MREWRLWTPHTLDGLPDRSTHWLSLLSLSSVPVLSSALSLSGCPSSARRGAAVAVPSAVRRAAASIGVDLLELSEALDGELRRMAEQRRQREASSAAVATAEQKDEGGGTSGPSSPPSSGSTSPSSSSPSLLSSTICSGAKVQEVVSLISRVRLHRPEDKVVVFSQFTRALDVLEVALCSVEAVGATGFVRFDGAMSSDAQQRSVEAFQRQPCSALSVLLISLQAGGVGLSLTAANHAVMLDVWYNPAIEGQAYDRIHRLSQRKDVFIHRLVVRDTVEQRMMRIQRDKGALANEAMRDEQPNEEEGEGGGEDVEGGQHSPPTGSRRNRRNCTQGFTLQALQRLFDDANEGDAQSR